MFKVQVENSRTKFYIVVPSSDCRYYQYLMDQSLRMKMKLKVKANFRTLIVRTDNSPCCQVFMNKVERFQALHPGGNLRGHVHQSTVTRRK